MSEMSEANKRRKVRAAIRKAEKLALKLASACAEADATVRTFSDDGEAGNLSQDLRTAAGLTHSMAMTLRLHME